MTGRPDNDEIERYRLAAEQALDQLDWCVDYLHRIRKSSEAKALASNRTSIRRSMQPGASR